MIKLIIRHKNEEKLAIVCADVKNILTENNKSIQYTELTGPFAPVIDKVRGEYIKCFYLKFARNNHLAEGKRELSNVLRVVRGGSTIIFDVDPL